MSDLVRVASPLASLLDREPFVTTQAPILALDPLVVARRPDKYEPLQLEAALEALEATLTASAVEEEKIAEQQRNLPPSASLNEKRQLEERRVGAAVVGTGYREARQRLQNALARWNRPIENLRAASPAQLAYQLLLAQRALATAQEASQRHDGARPRLLRRPGATPADLKPHDDEAEALKLDLDIRRVRVADLEEALAQAQARWHELEARFEAGIARARKEQAEERRNTTEYLGEAAPKVAAILQRNAEIRAFRDELHTLGRQLGRASEVPESAEAELRPGMLPLHHIGHIGRDEAQVTLPGRSESQRIWPPVEGRRHNPRGVQPVPPSPGGASRRAAEGDR
jgi:hypothetical protein